MDKRVIMGLRGNFMRIPFLRRKREGHEESGREKPWRDGVTDGTPRASPRSSKTIPNYAKASVGHPPVSEIGRSMIHWSSKWYVTCEGGWIFKKIQKERMEMRQYGKKENPLSISFRCSYFRFFLMPPSSCFRYQTEHDERRSGLPVGEDRPCNTQVREWEDGRDMGISFSKLQFWLLGHFFSR